VAYDAANRRSALTLPNGIVLESTYDDDSQLTALTYKLSGTPIGDLTYGYDANGRRVSIGGSYTRTNLPAGLVSATYDDANQIATWAGTSFAYDDNGNLTSDGSKSYSWNARNELTGIGGGGSASFAYDAAGRRRSRTVGSTTTQFLYDGLNPVQELASGTPVANLLTGLDIDEYFTRTDASGSRNLLTDALGSTIVLADGSGSVQTEYTYEPFGSVTTSGSSSANTFGFTGRENDGTGLNYYRARYYHPTLQRFIGEDRIGIVGGVNRHAYVVNRPTTFVDPLGLSPSWGRSGGWGTSGSNWRGGANGSGPTGGGNGGAGAGSGPSDSANGGSGSGDPSDAGNGPNDPLQCGQNLGQQGAGLPTDSSPDLTTALGNMTNEALSQLQKGGGAIASAGSAILEGGAAATSAAVISIQRRNQIEAVCAMGIGCAPSPVPVKRGCF
jgi:RHS repeat-associated protein